jgi:hypothetical protein
MVPQSLHAVETSERDIGLLETRDDPCERPRPHDVRDDALERIAVSHAVHVRLEARVVGELLSLEDVGAEPPPLTLVLHGEKHRLAVLRSIGPIRSDACMGRTGPR